MLAGFFVDVQSNDSLLNERALGLSRALPLVFRVAIAL